MQNQKDIKKQDDKATRNQIAFWKDLVGLLNASDDNKKHFVSLRQSILFRAFLLSDSVEKVQDLNPMSDVLSSFKKRGRLFRQAYRDNRSTTYNAYHQMFVAFFQVLLKKAVEGEDVIKLYPEQIKHLWRSYRDMQSMAQPKNSFLNQVFGSYWIESLFYKFRIDERILKEGSQEEKGLLRKEMLLYLPDAYPEELKKTMQCVKKICNEIPK